jgi:tetratricopeptide (TPR) repeat protein
LKLHGTERFAAALSCFEQALRVSPKCPFAMYDQANTLHSLGRDKEAEGPLRELIDASPVELFQRCPAANLRSVQVDAHFLLLRVLLYGRGFSEEAFAFAEKHFLLRRRGVYSVWSAKQIRANIAAMRRAWKAGVKLKGPAPPVSDLRQFRSGVKDGRDACPQ